MGSTRAEPAPFHPRITVLSSAQRSPVTCHHCEDAPVPEAAQRAITQHSDSVQVNQQKCIGCKACVVACPFGTMDMPDTPRKNSESLGAEMRPLSQGAKTARPARYCPAERSRSPPPSYSPDLAEPADSAAQGWTRAVAQRGRCSTAGNTKRADAGNPARGEPDKLAILKRAPV
ncbi:4Fe-4S binding protein [Shigella flexneri]